jgi:hypothetical protein
VRSKKRSVIPLAVSSTKPMHSHLLDASGGVEAVACARPPVAEPRFLDHHARLRRVTAAGTSR